MGTEAVLSVCLEPDIREGAEDAELQALLPGVRDLHAVPDFRGEVERGGGAEPEVREEWGEQCV